MCKGFQMGVKGGKKESFKINKEKWENEKKKN